LTALLPATYGGRKLPAGGALARQVRIAAVLSCGRAPAWVTLIDETSDLPAGSTSGFEADTLSATFRLPSNMPAPNSAYIVLSNPCTCDPATGSIMDPFITRPPAEVDAGSIFVMLTGPTTHQSPLANWPTSCCAENVHVIPN
jgi:hypothetical protein